MTDRSVIDKRSTVHTATTYWQLELKNDNVIRFFLPIRRKINNESSVWHLHYYNNHKNGDAEHFSWNHSKTTAKLKVQPQN